MFSKFYDRRRSRSSASERKLPLSNLSFPYLRTTARPDELASLLRPGAKTLETWGPKCHSSVLQRDPGCPLLSRSLRKAGSPKCRHSCDFALFQPNSQIGTSSPCVFHSFIFSL